MPRNPRVAYVQLGNTSTSFCIVRDGKPYYFAVKGWISPTRDLMKRFFLKYHLLSSVGNIIFLKVRTNLEPSNLIVEGECLVGELYVTCMYGGLDDALRLANDTYLVPFNIYDSDVFKLVNARVFRLHFKFFGFINSKVRIGNISIEPSPYNCEVNDVYVWYAKPSFRVTILDIKYIGKTRYYIILNITLRLKGIGAYVHWWFDKESGSREYFDVPNLFIYIVDKKCFYGHNSIRINGSIVCLDPLSRSGVAEGVKAGGFEDLWIEPEHEYINSVAGANSTVWMVLKVSLNDYIQDTSNGHIIVFETPWGSYTCKVPDDAIAP